MVAHHLLESQPLAVVLSKERQTLRPLDLESRTVCHIILISPPALKGFTCQVRIYSPETSMPRGLSISVSGAASNDSTPDVFWAKLAGWTMGHRVRGIQRAKILICARKARRQRRKERRAPPVVRPVRTGPRPGLLGRRLQCLRTVQRASSSTFRSGYGTEMEL